MGDIAVLSMSLESSSNISPEDGAQRDEAVPIIVNNNEKMSDQRDQGSSQNPQLNISDSTSTTSHLQTTTTTNAGSDNMTKKRKLTAAEKQEAQALKDAETQRKAEEKARKEEAKRLKDEEKRVKDEEKRQKQDDAKKDREEKQKIKDAAKAEKEAEKKAKEEAQAKKNKAQLRLGAFFKKPANDADGSGPSSRRSSIASLDGDLANDVGESHEAPAPIPQASEYDKAFPPFFLHPHTTLAPVTLQKVDEASIQSTMQQIEHGLRESICRPESILGKRKRSSYIVPLPVKRIMLEMQGTGPSNPIDLEQGIPSPAANLLNSIPIKVLRFKEDVRPPWIGTYSRAPERRRFAALCRNPFRRELPNVNYDYDSEAEWEEPEEGEDLNSEGEEDDEEEEDDMEGFLDDEAAELLPKRKQLIGDLEPIYTALNWEDPTRANTTTQFGSATLDMEQYRMGILLETPITFPIDPFSTSYWKKDTPTKPDSKAAAVDGNMKPPTRVPLMTLLGPNQIVPVVASEANAKPAKAGAVAKPIPPELLADFKKAISGSKLSKIGLIEVLKKDFPAITKKTVEQTLLQVAQRVGKKESDKTWQLID